MMFLDITHLQMCWMISYTMYLYSVVHKLICSDMYITLNILGKLMKLDTVVMF